MKEAFIKSLKIFKYLFLLFTLVYWIGIIIDDWVFIEKYWKTNLLEYLFSWFLYFLVFSLVFSVYFWIITSLIILIYHKIIKQLSNRFK